MSTGVRLGDCRTWSGQSTYSLGNKRSPCERCARDTTAETWKTRSFPTQGCRPWSRQSKCFAGKQTPVRTMRTLHRPRRRAQSATARPVSTTRLCRGTARARDHASARAFEISRAILGLVELGLDKVSVSFGTNYHDSDACHERSRCERCERDTVRGGMREQGVANVEG